MASGLSKDGFKRKTYNEIVEDMQARAKQFFGENINLSDRSPLGLFIKTIAWEIGVLWQIAEKVYYAAYIDDAEGKQLDGIVRNASVAPRRGFIHARGTITIVGTPGTFIASGFQVSTKNRIIFTTEKSAYIGEHGNVTINIIALKPGKEGNVPANTIIDIITPIAGVDEVANSDPTSGGEDIETDKELRERYYRSLAYGGSSTSKSVEAALLALPNVRDAIVEENDTMNPLNGLPPKCIAPYVYGGDDKEVAQTILGKKAGGIRSFGDTEVVITDDWGNDFKIGFTRPNIKDIYVSVQIEKGLDYPADGDSLVKTAVIAYIGGQDSDGTEYRGLRLGDDVILSKIVLAVSSVPGVNDVYVELSTDGVTYSHQNIKNGKTEIAATSLDKVVIT